MANKTYSEKTFTVSKDIYIVAETYETRYSWGHKAYLFKNGHEVDYAKITYYNRTWEAYQYESILQSLVRKTKKLTQAEKELTENKIKNGFAKEAEKEVKKEFATVGMVALLGDVFGTTTKEKNDWKARMLKAGLGNKGLTMPEDWDSLSEDEKETRLDKVIAELQK